MAAIREEEARGEGFTYLADLQLQKSDFGGARASLAAAGYTGDYQTFRLSQIVWARARAGDVSGAIAIADRLSEGSGKGDALCYVAAAQTDRGDQASAKQTLARAHLLVDRMPEASDKAGILRNIAGEETRAGDAEGAKATYAESVRIAGMFETAGSLITSLQYIAETQIKTGDFAAAAATVALLAATNKASPIPRAYALTGLAKGMLDAAKPK